MNAAELVADINTANGNGESDTIDLAQQTFSLAAVDNSTDGASGLPSILSDGGHALTIKNGVIERAVGAPAFRILHVSVGADLTLAGVTIQQGLAQGGIGAGHGGGVFNLGVLAVSASAISGNTAQLFGGGIYSPGELTVTGSTISGNSATASKGGGVFNSGDLTVTGSTISGNSAAVNGGGIDNYDGTATVTASTISGNSAQLFGGGIHNDGGDVTVTGSTISGNSSAVNGGGIDNYAGTLTVTGSTISGNSARFHGGGIDNFGGGVTVTGSTIGDNSAGDLGGGIHTDAAALLRSTIVAGNSGNDPDLHGLFDAEVSLIGDVGSATVNNVGLANNQLDVDPLLGPLQDNGGPTETHALAPGSPAIDHGNNFGAATEQRGATRSVEIPGVNDPSPGSGADIGAFELTAVVTTTGGKLFVEGTPLDDDIDFVLASGEVEVLFFGASLGVFGVPANLNRLIAFGRAGDDDVSVDEALTIDAKLVGGPGSDSLSGGGGNDILKGNAGRDTLTGGLGNDSLLGNAGNDVLDGGGGDDVLRGFSGNDLLRGGGQDDDLDGGAGSDILVGDFGADTLQGGNGRDLLIGGPGEDDLFGGGSDDILIGGSVAYQQEDERLAAVLDEWKSTSPYADRVNHLRGNLGGGLNGANLLVVDVDVVDDFAADDIQGDDGRDWYFRFFGLAGTGDDDNLIDQVVSNPGEEFVN